jgi:LPS-assembly protein
MIRPCAICLLILSALALPCAVLAQKLPEVELKVLSDQGWVEYDYETGLGTGTGGVFVVYGNAVLTADRVTVDQKSDQVVAEGRVRIQHEDQVWAGEVVRYNFRTRQMETEQFRTGRNPVFAAGYGLYSQATTNTHTHATNQLYGATNSFITTDDISEPAFKVRARYIKIIPGDKIIARDAVLYVEGVPVFYFPYYSRNLGERANNFNFTPGYRSSFGPFLLSSYNFFLGNELDGNVHVDYREKRGFGAGPNVNYHLGPWGDGSFRYYYLHDEDPSAFGGGSTIPDNRQRVYFSYQANPQTNLNLKAMVRYQGDTNILREFFEGEYVQNPQPSTFVEANKSWPNFSLDTYVQPRVNDFLDTVERLPDVRLTGFRQQLGATPVYYESETSIGYYRRLFPETNNVSTGLNYSATRADTYHQLLLPETFFGWLNFTPRVGGRYTYYGTATGPGATTDEINRGVFNTGAELSCKASRLWPGLRSDFWELDGLRHIIEPSINYVFVPEPNAVGTNQIPQFDYELPSLRLLPIDFPDYNSIDSIDSQNVLRLGLHNRLQTKRNGQLVNFVNWDLYTDWRIQPNQNQTTFADLYSDFVIRPRSWLTLESLTRYDVEDGLMRMSLTTVTLQPHPKWSWTLGQFYLRDNYSSSPTAWGEGNNLFTSTIYYRLNENWGLRASHRFDASTGELQEQAYSVYRDLRSWTAALTCRWLNNVNGGQDFTIAFTFSLKVAPRYGLGTDTGRSAWLWGG